MAWDCPKTNITNVTSQEEWALNLRKFIPYIGVGGFTVFGNVLIIVAIVRHKSMHANYFLTAALAGGDFCQGAGYLTAGCMRLITVGWGTHKVCYRFQFHQSILKPYPKSQTGLRSTVISANAVAEAVEGS